MSEHIDPTIGRSVWYRGKDNAIRAAIITHIWSRFLVNLQVFGKDQNDTEAGIHTLVTHGDIEHEPSCCPSWSWMPYQKGQAAKTEVLEQKLCSGSVGCGTDDEIEAKIKEKRLNAPRLTPSDIESVIKSASYTVLPSGRVTICELTLTNGFTVRGESSCVSIENFDKQLGEEIAFQDAREKIWQLEGYLLKERLHNKAELEAIRYIPTSADNPICVPTIEDVAEACHDINRAYCQAIGDDSQPSWDDAPEWQKSSAISGVKFHLENPDASPSASHESWLAQKKAEGWKYGAVKNADLKEHPCFVHYSDLPKEQKAKDYLFKQTVHSFKPFIY
jgi:hypothetical protein